VHARVQVCKEAGRAGPYSFAGVYVFVCVFSCVCMCACMCVCICGRVSVDMHACFGCVRCM
jgi:hypothetical protein